MKLLNVGCGSNRPGEPWTNLDNLHGQLKPGTPERINLDKESNYVEWNLGSQDRQMLFSNDEFDGILISHVVEHFDCLDAVRILSDCRRVLKPGGSLVVSVPDAEYFLKVHSQDTPERAVELFGEPICPDEPWHKSFFDYALWFNQHKQILTLGSMWCLLLRSGFTGINIGRFIGGKIIAPYRQEDAMSEEWRLKVDVRNEILTIMNRRKFSLEMCAVK